ncbi:MAG: hypothetical protein ACXWP5_14680 [Bdellovibrionota bacterium]
MIFWLALLLAGSAHGADRCEVASDALGKFLAALPDRCRVDSDCAGYYYHVDPCAAPVVRARPGASVGPLAGRLHSLQSRVRRDCERKARVACSPKPFRAFCEVGHCKDALELGR